MRVPSPCCARALSITVLVLLAASGSGAGELSLVDGSLLRVSECEVDGALVRFTLADGSTGAFRVEDVDLEASGLLAEPETTDAGAGRWSLAAVPRLVVASSEVRITDADVEHVLVQPEPVERVTVEPEEEETRAGEQAPRASRLDEALRARSSALDATVGRRALTAAAFCRRAPSMAAGTLTGTLGVMLMLSGAFMIVSLSCPGMTRSAGQRIAVRSATARMARRQLDWSAVGCGRFTVAMLARRARTLAGAECAASEMRSFAIRGEIRFPEEVIDELVERLEIAC